MTKTERYCYDQGRRDEQLRIVKDISDLMFRQKEVILTQQYRFADWIQDILGCITKIITGVKS